MNKINLALTSGTSEDARDTTTTVHLNATFENREAAIEFHARVAALTRDATVKANRAAGIGIGGRAFLPRLGWR